MDNAESASFSAMESTCEQAGRTTSANNLVLEKHGPKRRTIGAGELSNQQHSRGELQQERS
jgi:hypothetical protein